MFIAAPCKINLGLQILRRRSDGYHDIATAMVTVPWADIIEAVPAQGNADSLATTGNKVACPPEKNLVMKAIRAMRAHVDFPPVAMHLHKIVSDGAGLGGGSSDAAFTVRAIDRLFDLGLDTSAMAGILATVGSDCPFFVYDRPMLATGTGTTLTPVDIDLSGLHIVIAKPGGVSISTAHAYAGVQPGLNCADLRDILAMPVEQWQGRLINDFEESIFAQAPQVRQLRDRMKNLGAVYAAMSGSGAAVFGLFRDMPAMDDIDNTFSECAHFSASL